MTSNKKEKARYYGTTQLQVEKIRIAGQEESIPFFSHTPSIARSNPYTTIWKDPFCLPDGAHSLEKREREPSASGKEQGRGPVTTPSSLSQMGTQRGKEEEKEKRKRRRKNRSWWPRNLLPSLLRCPILLLA